MLVFWLVDTAVAVDAAAAAAAAGCVGVGYTSLRS